jgi:hypothetical protein
MTIHPRSRITAAVATLCGIAAIAAGVALGPAAAAARPQHRPGTAAAAAPVVINCTGHAQIRPGRYILACGDGNAYLRRLHWAAWGQASAFGTGTDTFNICIPSCAAGHLRSFPVLAALWRARPRPSHPGQRYFTRLTIIYSGLRSYRAGGKTHHLPQTVTFPLSASGGA